MEIAPFELHVPDATLEDLHERLRRGRRRLPLDVANEDWSYGTNRAYLEQFVDWYLDGYDWRAEEARINAVPQFRAELAPGVPIHFLHVPGKGPDPLPLLVTPSNPLSQWDMHKTLGPLTDPAAHGGDPADAFTLIVPSLPGHHFSTPLTRSGIGFAATADLWVTLMDMLGYERFGASGGGFGGAITAQLGHKHPERLIGCQIWFMAQLSYYQSVNLDAPPGIEYEHNLPARSAYGPDEEGWYDRNLAFAQGEGGLQALISKPQTIAYGMHDSPVGLLAWLLEKRRNWSDCSGDVEAAFTRTELATAFTLEWVSESFVTSARYYRESLLNPWRPSHRRMPVVEAPTGVTNFVNGVFRMPRAWAERYYDLRRYTVCEQGGYFVPMEQPGVLVHELRELFRPLR